MQYPLIIEHPNVTRTELERQPVLLVVDHFAELAARSVELVRPLDGHWRSIPPRLRRQPDPHHPLFTPGVVRQLNHRLHRKNHRAPVAPVVLEPHRHCGQQLEGLRVLLPQPLRHVPPIHGVVHHGAARAGAEAVRAGAVLDGVEELEGGDLVAVGVVHVEPDGLRGVRQILHSLLASPIQDLCVWHRLDVEHLAPLRGAQRAHVGGQSRAHSGLCRRARHHRHPNSE
mmetsp:Transcript_94747/g.253422  ORF Transcript_94747/g.253422 Transcript_94747/m.253422 type:complete len:228 (-) Transcript_94747:506-1189(-)